MAHRLLTISARRVRVDQRGFTLVETVLAMALFALVASALAGLLISSIHSNDLAKTRTSAQQAANAQIEWIRSIVRDPEDYYKIGTTSGYPTGVIEPTGLQNGDSPRPLASGLTMTTSITFVDDPAPASYRQSANYKKIVVTVTRTRDNRQLAQQITHLAPPTRQPFGSGIINVTVRDMGDNTPVVDAPVTLADGPTPGGTLDTGATGVASFQDLQANTTMSPYYTVSVAPPVGYAVLSDDIAPSSAAKHALAPTETWDTVLRLYRPSTIRVHIVLSDGTTPFTGTASVKVSSTRGNETFTYDGATNGGTLQVTQVAGETLVPGEYTVSTVGGLSVTPQTSQVPTAYPSDLTSDFTLVAQANGNLAADVTWGGEPVDSAAVTVTGGPGMVNLNGTTDATGAVTFFNLMPGSGYTVTATKAGESATTTSTVPSSGTAFAALALPVGTVRVTATQASSPASGAVITLEDGPNASFSRTLTADASGVATFTNVPVGTGYTVTAARSGQTVTGSASVTASTTTDVALTIPSPPTGTMQVDVTQNGSPASAATVTVTGGPYGYSGSAITNGSGVATFTGVFVGSGYTVTATKGGLTVTNSSVTQGAGTTNVALTLPATGSLTVNVTQNGSAVASATVDLTGGPDSVSLSGTTNGSGQVVFAGVPAGAGYAVTATKSSVRLAAANASFSVPAGGTTITLATVTVTVNVKRGSSNQRTATATLTGGPASVSLTGTTNSSGNTTFAVQTGSGYVVKAWKCSVSNPKSGTDSSVSVTGAMTVYIVFSTNTCPLP